MIPTSSSPRNADYRKRCEAKPFHMYFSAKRSECKRKGIPIDITPEYLEGLWTGLCPIFGVELNRPMRAATGRGSHQTAHLDRKDPDKGYTWGNVHWISGRANRIKYDATVDELKAIVAYMETH